MSLTNRIGETGTKLVTELSLLHSRKDKMSDTLEERIRSELESLPELCGEVYRYVPSILAPRLARALEAGLGEIGYDPRLKHFWVVVDAFIAALKEGQDD
jgi:hypothetical protein